jgi:hypothetical protein
MGRKEEKGMESTQQEGEKGETMQVVEVTTHDDDDRAGETGHRSKDEDEEALARVEEMRKSAEAKRALRQANLAPERPGKSLFFLISLASLCKLACQSMWMHMQFYVQLLWVLKVWQ